MRKKLKIFFIGHECTLTGAPILLLNLIEMLSKYGDYELGLVLARGGILESKYREVVPVYVLKPDNYSFQKNFFKRIIQFLKFRYHLLTTKQILKHADVIISNTVANGKLVKEFSKINVPVLTYVHELESVIKFYNSSNSFQEALKLSKLFISPSDAVASNLILNHNVRPDDVDYLPYFMKSTENIDFETVESYKKKFFAKYSIPKEKFYVVGMGTATNRKGIDLFLEVCKLTVKGNKNICFVWVGDFEDEATRLAINDGVVLNNLQEHFFVTGKLTNSALNLSPFDVFFLSSREDPYPLVVLEAALLRIPTLYFSNTGGISEFIKADAGWSVENFNVKEVSEKILKLESNRSEIKEKGECAYKRVTSIHTNSGLIKEQFDNIIFKAVKS